MFFIRLSQQPADCNIGKDVFYRAQDRRGDPAGGRVDAPAKALPERLRRRSGEDPVEGREIGIQKRGRDEGEKPDDAVLEEMVDVRDPRDLVQGEAQKGDDPEEPQVAAQPVVAPVEALVVLEIIDDLQQGDAGGEGGNGAQEIELQLRYRLGCRAGLGGGLGAWLRDWGAGCPGTGGKARAVYKQGRASMIRRRVSSWRLHRLPGNPVLRFFPGRVSGPRRC